MVKKLLLYSLFFSWVSGSAQTYVMSNTPITTCTGFYEDPGGTGNYSDNSNFTQTICSGSGSCVSLSFSSFSIEDGFDFLTVYDGPSTSSAQIPGSPFTGSTNPGTIICTSGCMTLVFTSDFSVNDIGWSATITCGACPPPPPPPDHTYAWTQKESIPAPGRHRSTAISIGSRGYAGLGHITSTPETVYEDWWEYDPGTNSWTQKADFLGGQRLHACGFTLGNYGYVGTGRDVSGVERNDFYKYDPSSNTWSPIASIPDAGLRGSASFAIGGKGYVATGSYGNEMWEYNPATNAWTAKTAFPGIGRSSAAGFAIGSKGYVGTGDDGGPLNDFWEYDPATNAWTAKANYGGVPRMEAGNFALLGKGYIGTGCDYQAGDNYGDFWQYDPAVDMWKQVADFSGAARRYLSCFVIGTRAFGCFGTGGTNYNDLWEYGNYSGIDESNFSTISVNAYPNPFFDKVTILIPDKVSIEKNASLSVFDVNGTLVKKVENITDHQLLIDRSGLSNGIYFFEIILNNSTRATGKFIAQ